MYSFIYTRGPTLRASVSLSCPFSSSLGIQGSFCEKFLQNEGQKLESAHCEKHEDSVPQDNTLLKLHTADDEDELIL